MARSSLTLAGILGAMVGEDGEGPLAGIPSDLLKSCSFPTACATTWNPPPGPCEPEEEERHRDTGLIPSRVGSDHRTASNINVEH